MGKLSPEAARERARLASLTRSRSADDPDLIDTRRNLRTAMLAQHIQRRLSEAPPLTEEQRRRLAGLFAGGAAQ